MKKIFINELDTEKRNNLIKNNTILINQLQDDLYETQMFQQQTEAEELLGKESYKYIDIRDNYNSFFLVLKDWEKMIQNINKDYIATDEARKLYNYIQDKKEILYTMAYYSKNYERLEEHLENKSEELLKMLEEQLHEYEELPDEDDAIQYAYEMDKLDDYYIEEREDGTTDGVIRLDVAYTECFI